MSLTEIARYERKYLLTEAKAQAMVKYVGVFLVPDEHMAGHTRQGYRVYTLYLDTPQLALYRQTTEGIKNRYKLRVRFYDLCEKSPAFLEIKSRDSETIRKQRAAVAKAAAERFLRGGGLVASDLVSPGEGTLRAMGEFCQRSARLGAQPIAFVSYWREAYVMRQSHRVRVTFDRHVVGHKYYPGCGLTIPDSQAPAAPEQVVLELKYNGAMPGWMQGLVLSFGLERTSFPKYVQAARALKLDRTVADRLVRSVPC
jgi:hypothetical protein